MRRVYADTSAIACLLKAEPHTRAMRLWLEAGECEVVSSDLLEIELRRLAVRLGRPQGEVTLILRGISVLTYDMRLSDAAREVGLEVIAP